MRLTAANILTLSRLVLAPIFVILFVAGYDGWALLVFSVAGATDLIDGTVARAMGQHSHGGALLDPIADKLLVQSCFIALTIAGILPLWFLALAFARDLMIMGGIIYLDNVGAPLPMRATLISKIATLFQLSVAVFGLWLRWQPSAELAGLPIESWLLVLVYITAVLIVCSGAKYVSMGVGILRKHRMAGAH